MRSVGAGTAARDPRGGSAAGGGARGRPPARTGPLAHRRPRPPVRCPREQVAAGGRGKGPPRRRWASGSQRVPDSSSFLSNFLIILDDFPAPRHTAIVPGAAADRRKRLQEDRPRALAPVGPPSRHSRRRPALPGCRGRSRPRGTWPRPLTLPQPAEAGPGAGSQGSRRGPCGDRSHPGILPGPPCRPPGSPGWERAECDFIWLTCPECDSAGLSVSGDRGERHEGFFT